MRKIIFLLIIFLLQIAVSGEAQIVKEKSTRAERRAKNKVNRRVDQTIDDAVDDAFNKIGSIFKKKKKKKKGSNSGNDSSESAPPPSNDSSSPDMSDEEMAEKMSGVLGKEAKTKDSYSFSTTITMHTYTEKKSGKTKNEADMDWMFSTDGTAFAMSAKETKHEVVMIMDMENTSMINLNQKDKQAMTFSMDMSDAKDIADEENEKKTFKKTGRIKSILGYSCAEYVVKDEEEGTSGTFWFTKQLKGMDFSKMAGPKRKKRKSPWDALTQSGGAMLESSMTEKNGKTFHMQATKVDKRTKTFTLSNYKVMSLGNMMNRGN